ncbi:tRNA (5-methylaminomethyl-2-thiouridylate)-methyltransferase [Ceratobasidium sp. AG-Ba]|nr:tRNA (5-methylaminomethyl-2-thiouridylate)-methyltransferase [Ceratobasidium sp. AG-Ba]
MALHRLAPHSWRAGLKKGSKVAMSGGVDSSVTAAILAAQVRPENHTLPPRWAAMRNDFSREYWNRVFTPALDAWTDGRTPNPDVFCNREIKFGSLFDRVVQDSQTYLATGHYAQIAHHGSLPHLSRAKDMHKDQTYYLSSVRQSRLAQTLFPIGHFTKPQLRELAAKMKLPTADRGESMGLCFVGERGRFSNFLSQYIPPSPGPILLHPSLRQIGTHQGLYTFTIGQNARIPGQPKKLFIAGKDRRQNALLVVDSVNHPALMCTSVRLRAWQWISEDVEEVRVLNERASSPSGMPVLSQIRHRMAPVDATLHRSLDGRFEIRFKTPLLGVAAGQVGAAWDGEWCLGCGEIDDTICLA